MNNYTEKTNDSQICWATALEREYAMVNAENAKLIWVMDVIDEHGALMPIIRPIEKKQLFTISQLRKNFNLDNTDAISVFSGRRRLDQVKTGWTVKQLFDYEFPSQKWLIPEFLPVGLIILAGRPKLGKSWLALQMAKCISSEGEFFGKQCTKGNCFYLALEDSPRRIKSRMTAQKWHSVDDVIFETKLPDKLDRGGLEWLSNLIKERSFKFVVIDTISRAISPKIRQLNNDEIGNLYDQLQAIALDNDAAILVIDHLNKMHKDSDFLDGIMGGTSKTAVADAILGLRKENRGQTRATLEITGRDVLEDKYVLNWLKDGCLWELIGDHDAVILDASVKKLINSIESLTEPITQDIIIRETKWSQGYASKIIAKAIEQGVLSQVSDSKPYTYRIETPESKLIDNLKKVKNEEYEE